MIELCVPNATIEHVGGSAIVGAKTKGDLDIAVQVSKEDFLEAQKSLYGLYSEKNTQYWSDSFSIFHTIDDSVPIDIMLVVRGTKWDTFVIFRDLINGNKELFAEYNEMKDRIAGKDYEFQKEEKKKLYTKVLSGRGLEGY